MAWVGLILLPGVGPRTIARWVGRAGSPEAVWRHLPAFLESQAEREEVLAAWRSLEPGRILARARMQGMAVVTISDPAFPPLLRMIPDPPPVLFVRGTPGDGPMVAVIGSRRATPYGLAAASRLAFDLADSGVTVVSGLARGIDAAAHQAALDAGGRTIAVLGSGADVIYPPEHRRLAAAVAEGGALMTELPPGAPPLRAHFPRRNRIISGLSLGVVVVEGAQDSGALVTVDCALEQGREVFAVPGSIFSNHSRAPHHLLREGARVVERVEDILTELGLPVVAGPRLAMPETGVHGRAGSAPEDGGPDAQAPIEARVLALVEAGPRTLDDLAAQSGLPPAAVAATVTLLELRGLILTQPGQMVMRAPSRARRRTAGQE